MYEKYLIKDFNKQTFDCCHLATEFLNNNFEIDTSVIDNYSREYNIKQSYNCIIDGFTKNDFVEVDDKYKKGDIIVTETITGGGCWVCVDDTKAITIRRIKEIDNIINKKNHLRHKSLL